MYVIGFEKIPNIAEVYVEQLDGGKHLYCTSVCIENLPVLKVADLLENASHYATTYGLSHQTVSEATDKLVNIMNRTRNNYL